jgi:hypothetical protein
MPTRAQTTRDAALRRLTRVNRSLALAAVVSAGVITDVVASTASGHARTITTARETNATGRVELLTSPQNSPTRKPRRNRHRAVTHHSTAAPRSVPAPPAASSSASSTPAATSSAPSSSAASSAPVTVQPTVVAVSGGS